MTTNTSPVTGRTGPRTGPRLRRWARLPLALAVPAAAALPVLLGAPAAEAASFCTTDCVAVTAQPGVDRLVVDVQGTTPVTLAGRITTQDGTKVLGTTVGTDLVTQDAFTVTGLPAGTTYRYDVWASDVAGNTWRETGYTRTLVRDVTVALSTIEITDDGDLTGAGQIVGAVQLTDATGSCLRKPLAPFSMTTPRKTSSGPPLDIASTADPSCAGTSASPSVEAHLAEDDTDPWDDCSGTWPWKFPAGGFGNRVGSNDCADWNFSRLQLQDPMAPVGAGSKSVDFTSVSSSGAAGSGDVGPEWVLKGTATFIHRALATSLPLGSVGPAALPVTVDVAQHGFTASWKLPSVPGMDPDGAVVSWREPGGTWSTRTVQAPTTSTTVDGLDAGTAYEVQVVVHGTAGQHALRALSTVTTTPITTTLAGWSGAAVTGKQGTRVSFAATVSGPTGRTVLLQVRGAGAQDWSTRQVLHTSASGQVSGMLPVLTGVRQWRLSAPSYAGASPVDSATRTLTARTTITGFATTRATKPVGTVVKDAIKVTPGKGRTVVVQFRKAGTKVWKTWAKRHASAKGTTTVQLKAFPGTTSWRVKVTRSNLHGSAAVTRTRTIRGR